MIPAIPRSATPLLAPLLLLATLPAWADARGDIRAAMDRMLAARSYHAVMQVAGDRPMTNTIDFAAPDRYRMTLPMGTQTIIGDSLWMSMNGMHMKMPLPAGTLTKWRDPANLDKTMATTTVQALGADAVDGQPARKYQVTNTQSKPGTSTLWIGANGYPLQIQVDGHALGKATTTTIRYTRFNAPSIRIEAP